jgi:NAD dependent epimerase/dehydratase family enzyme
VEDERIRGPINTVSPNPVTNADFTHALGEALHRPAILPVPAFGLRAAFGEMADQALLASARVVPARLEAVNFPFADPEIHGALRAVLAE